MTARRPLRSRALASPLALVLALALAFAGRAHAVSIDQPRAVRVDDWAGAVFKLSDAFSERIEQTLDRGMPATVVVTVDVWEDRTGWFDRLVAEQTVAWRASRNVWSDDFTLKRGLDPEHTVADIAAAEAEIGRPMRVRIAPFSQL